MRNKPIPPMSKAMWSRYWAASWGVKTGAGYRVQFNDPAAGVGSGGEINGVFTGITPSGDLTFNGDGKTYHVPLEDGITMKRRCFVKH